jgi:cobalt/nickel transport system permease protein
MAALIFVMRVATSVSLVVLLLLTTKWSHLLKALRVLFVPQVFTFIISMTYRYIHLLLRLIEDVLLAKKSRVIRKNSVGEGQKWVSSQIGTMMKRSLRMSEDVYSAMVSRGFNDEMKVIDSFKMKRLDYLWSAFLILFVSLVMGLNKIWG